ncbi:MAG: hypothetical protein PHE02_08390 [Lachnospiraceae bacterium]|nr:hypothetical protein [Lachnospiraceae bacterium]
MKRKLIPPYIMLQAGAIASIVMFLNNYEIKTMLWILIAVLIVFYIVGVIIRKVMDSFDKELEKKDKAADEGEVIEKENTESANTGEEKKEQDKNPEV